jgi:diguanylate cyclase (GGDEF)-like protein/PAS domain S-box-containing protein
MKHFFQSITARIAIWMAIISMLPLLLIAYNLHYKLRDQMIQQHLSNLKVVFKQTVQTIDSNLNYQKQLLSNIAAMPKIAEKLEGKHDSNPISLDPLIENYITNIINKYGYYDLLIMTPKGDIVYSYKKESDFGKNLLDAPLNKTPLAKVFDRASSMLDTSLSPLEFYEPSNRKSSFIATPILSNHAFIGVIAVQINEHMIFDQIKSYNGLGDSGEIVAGALIDQKRIVAAIPLKYDSDAFKNERQLNAGNNATGMVQAVDGCSGSGEIIDYRGVESVAVWGYEPNLQWGIVVKTDTQEVLFDVYEGEKRLFILLIFVVLGILIAILLSVKRITNPINNLIRSIKLFRKEGTFDLESIQCDGEICYLSEEFSAMANEIHSYHKTLEAKISERTDELRKANKKIENYLEIVNRFVITSSTDLSGKITYASQAFEEISGYTQSELIGKNHRIVKDPQMPDSIFDDLWQTITSGKDWHGEIRNIAKDGSYYWVDIHIAPNRNDEGVIIGYTAIRQNITDRKTIEAISVTDQLTGLYNRRHLDEKMEENQHLFERYGTPFSIILIDLDHFKSVNDTYGHQIGDRVLSQTADILKTKARNTDIIGRWGGEEFLVILPSTTHNEALIVAEKIRSAIETASFGFPQTASLGVAQYEIGIEHTLKCADEALYMAKQAGRNRIILHTAHQ